MTEAWRPEDDRPRAASGPVRVRVPAKINLHLAVGAVRADGFHELTTVYQAIGLYDELTARHGDTLGLTMAGEGTGELALDDSNLIIRAARALAAHTAVPPLARLHLRKQIPLAGGLAGGSADAAAALVALDALWGTGLSREQLTEVAVTLGSDVPFLIYGGTALGTGRGEIVNPVLVRPVNWHWVVAVADGGLSTPQVYAELDRLRAAGAAPPPLGSTDRLLGALRQRDPRVLGEALGNDLQPAALSLRPALADTLAAGQELGAVAGIVSGSGPTLVFLTASADRAARLADALAESGTCRSALAVAAPVAGARVV